MLVVKNHLINCAAWVVIVRAIVKVFTPGSGNGSLGQGEGRRGLLNAIPGLGAVYAGPVAASYFEFIGFTPLKPHSAVVDIAALGVHDGAIFPVAFFGAEVFYHQHPDEELVLFSAGAVFAAGIGAFSQQAHDFTVEPSILLKDFDMRFGFAGFIVYGFPHADGRILGHSRQRSQGKKQ